jgi:uncharacterized protein with PQ loop repeat
MLIHALGCLGAALSMSLSWPQVYKSCVQRRTNGLSATACMLSVALRMSLGSALAVLFFALVSGGVAALPSVAGRSVAPMLGLFLAGVTFLAAVPQPLALLRDRGQDLSGLSPLRWRLGAGASASWLLYGLATGQAALWASASIGLISTGIVCAVLYQRTERTYIEHPRWRESITTRNVALLGV